jgi:hypothetical protein
MTKNKLFAVLLSFAMTAAMMTAGTASAFAACGITGGSGQ